MSADRAEMGGVHIFAVETYFEEFYFCSFIVEPNGKIFLNYPQSTLQQSFHIKQHRINCFIFFFAFLNVCLDNLPST